MNIKLRTVIQAVAVRTAKLDGTLLSRLMIGRLIARRIKCRTHRTIFYVLWFVKAIVIYWMLH